MRLGDHVDQLYSTSVPYLSTRGIAEPTILHHLNLASVIHSVPVGSGDALSTLIHRPHSPVPSLVWWFGPSKSAQGETYGQIVGVEYFKAAPHVQIDNETMLRCRSDLPLKLVCAEEVLQSSERGFDVVCRSSIGWEGFITKEEVRRGGEEVENDMRDTDHKGSR